MDQGRTLKCESLYKPAKWCFILFVLTGITLVIVHSIMQSTMRSPPSPEPVRVRTISGDVTGTARTRAGRTFLSFEGLPYAQPPVGALRFKDPQLPVTAWNGTLRAWVPRPACLAVDKRSPSIYSGDEDCLYLNVYTPALEGSAAVMVWLGGGAFSHRDGDSLGLAPDRLVDQGVVLVTVQYRRGVLGFLSTGDLASPGNYGLKDQAAALGWVRGNAAAFGGDPARVTIAGVGAGAASIGFHLLSPVSKGLFSGAIAMGGSPLNPWAFSRDPHAVAARLAEDIARGSFQDSSQLVAFLRNLPAVELVRKQASVFSSEGALAALSPVLAPCAEPPSPAAFLTQPPWHVLEDGLPNAVPLLTGASGADASHLLTESALRSLDRRFVELVAPALRLPSADQRRRVAAQVRSFYFGDEDITSAATEDVHYMLSDMTLLEGVDRMARTVATLSPQPVYYYHHASSQNATEPAGITYEDINRHVLYSSADGLETDPNSEAAILRDTWLTMLAEFVKTGTPGAGGVSWPAYSVASPWYLQAEGLAPARDLHPARMDFWRSCLPPRLRI